MVKRKAMAKVIERFNSKSKYIFYSTLMVSIMNIIIKNIFQSFF